MLTRGALHHARSKTIFFLVKRIGRGRNDDEFSRTVQAVPVRHTDFDVSTENQFFT